MYLAGRIKFDGEDYFLCWMIKELKHQLGDENVAVK